MLVARSYNYLASYIYMSNISYLVVKKRLVYIPVDFEYTQASTKIL
jgi:hypothetical protein